MMPLEGTWMHWFLTNRTIHLWISLVCTRSRTITSSSHADVYNRAF